MCKEYVIKIDVGDCGTPCIQRAQIDVQTACTIDRARGSHGELYRMIMDRFMRRLIDPRVNPIFGVAREGRGQKFRSRDIVKIVEKRGQKVAENLTSVRPSVLSLET